MSNRKPKMPPPPVTEKENPSIITEMRSYRLITPLYGGGVEPEKADPITVVRATEIRGHLRFWWRATCGGAYPTVDALRRAEEEIWGSAGGKGKAGPSKVVVVVSVKSLGKEEVAFEVKSKKIFKNGKGTIKPDTQGSPKVADYAAFPLMPKAKGKNNLNETKQIGWQSNPVLLGVEFEVALKYPDKYQNDVEAALWAWETFGGIGARTRRGFGALQRVDENVSHKANPQSVKEWLEENLNHYVVENGKWPRGVPHLSLKSTLYMITKRKSDGIQAWMSLITALREFRQEKARYDKNNPNKQKDQGLSQWPEANAIRGELKLQPKPDGISDDKLIDKYPRAVFGLPIIFHMPHDKSIKDDLNLRGVKMNNNDIGRLASPIILRPIACQDGAVGLALILEWEPVDSDEPYTPPGGLRLIGEGLNKPVKSKLGQGEAAKIPILKNESNVLQAFLESLKGK